MMLLAGKRVTVVGMGVSGVAAAELCLRHGARVTGLDQRAASELRPEVRRLPIELFGGGDVRELLERTLRGVDLVVVSPGVDLGPAARTAAAAGAEVIGELELGARFARAPICAVGGTNGKSTTTELVAAMLRQAGRRVFCGGNLGTPLSAAAGEDWDQLVVEVSSFQLEHAPTFRPHVSLLLNITDDHLDRHGTFEAYADAKGNAFVNQTPDDVAIAPFADPIVEGQVRRGQARVVFFGSGGDYTVQPSGVMEASTGQYFGLERTTLGALHNRWNAAAAIAAARALRVAPEPIQQALEAYQPLPHRLAFVEEIAGVRFYDDSKATNVGAAVAAIGSVAEPKVVLIAGGKGKEGSYEPLSRELRSRGRAVVLIGEAAEVMQGALAGSVAVERAPSLEAAVERGFRLAQPGDAVLLAPACASFDMFRSYADRGERFVSAVRDLALREKVSVT